MKYTSRINWNEIIFDVILILYILLFLRPGEGTLRAAVRAQQPPRLDLHSPADHLAGDRESAGELGGR